MMVKPRKYGAVPECKGEETGDPLENPPTSDVLRHDSHMRKPKGGPVGNRTRFPLVGRRWVTILQSPLEDGASCSDTAISAVGRSHLLALLAAHSRPCGVGSPARGLEGCPGIGRNDHTSTPTPSTTPQLHSTAAKMYNAARLRFGMNTTLGVAHSSGTARALDPAKASCVCGRGSGMAGNNQIPARGPRGRLDRAVVVGVGNLGGSVEEGSSTSAGGSLMIGAGGGEEESRGAETMRSVANLPSAGFCGLSTADVWGMELKSIGPSKLPDISLHARASGRGWLPDSDSPCPHLRRGATCVGAEERRWCRSHDWATQVFDALHEKQFGGGGKAFPYITGPLRIRQHRHGSNVIRVQTVDTRRKEIQPVKTGGRRHPECVSSLLRHAVFITRAVWPSRERAGHLLTRLPPILPERTITSSDWRRAGRGSPSTTLSHRHDSRDKQACCSTESDEHRVELSCVRARHRLPASETREAISTTS
ncbi:hypothetical protein PR048_027327 [Dryococelus australis]|uniref:Uncharacterized protein n=1 Tax=Dryococelus australis TaxID=614101 RepID=A0ABQ9GF54_9NEOP|nr:hypothetical protein PR048_027327 [Dryococelus australis]